MDETRALKHDLDRHIGIASDLATENERLRRLIGLLREPSPEMIEAGLAAAWQFRKILGRSDNVNRDKLLARHREMMKIAFAQTGFNEE